MKVPMIIYNLKCGHTAKAPATLISGPLRCGVHQDVSPIESVHVLEWRMYCDGCQLARWSGLSKAMSEQLANAHARRTSHTTHIQYVANPEAMKTQEKIDRFHSGRLRA